MTGLTKRKRLRKNNLKMDKKLVKTEIVYHRDGTFQIHIKNDVKLTEREIDSLKQMAVAKYPSLLHIEKIYPEQTLIEEERHFDMISRTGFFSNVPKLNIMIGSKIVKFTKEEYLKKVQEDLDKRLDNLTLQGETEMDTIDMNDNKLSKKERAKAEQTFKDIKSGKIKDISETPVQYRVFTSSSKDNNKRKDNYGLLGKSKKPIKKTDL